MRPACCLLTGFAQISAQFYDGMDQAHHMRSCICWGSALPCHIWWGLLSQSHSQADTVPSLPLEDTLLLMVTHSYGEFTTSSYTDLLHAFVSEPLHCLSHIIPTHSPFDFKTCGESTASLLRGGICTAAAAWAGRSRSAVKLKQVDQTQHGAQLSLDWNRTAHAGGLVGNSWMMHHQNLSWLTYLT